MMKKSIAYIMLFLLLCSNYTEAFGCLIVSQGNPLSSECSGEETMDLEATFFRELCHLFNGSLLLSPVVDVPDEGKVLINRHNEEAGRQAGHDRHALSGCLFSFRKQERILSFLHLRGYYTYFTNRLLI